MTVAERTHPASPLAKLGLKLVGWQFEGETPTAKKYVCLATPHTSNWDGLLLVALTESIGLKMRWMIKDTWFKGPMGALLRRYGAVAINRSRATNVVDQMVALFERSDELVLIIPPEGTRSRAEHWKSGFYHIARRAQVPVVPAYLDYSRKRARLGPAIEMTGDVKADMDRIRAFYAEFKPKGRFHDLCGPIRLREEEST